MLKLGSQFLKRMREYVEAESKLLAEQTIDAVSK